MMKLTAPFFDHVRSALLGGRMPQAYVDGCNALAAAAGDMGFDEFAYVLATAHHETAATLRPITEFGKRAYFDRYEMRADLGNVKKGDGFRYRGRGFVQITGRANYRKYGIEHNPDDALKPDIAAAIIIDGMARGKFTGKKLADYFGANGPDPIGARRIINGTDRAKLIAGYWTVFREALNDMQAIPGNAEKVATTGKPAAQSTTIIAATAGGALTTINAVNEAAKPVREAVEAGKGLQETITGIVSSPGVLLALLVVVALVWIVRERLRHSRENGV